MASGSPSMNKIEKAHQMYRDGKYRDALNYYTDALFMAKTTPQKIALHSNRAACYLKLHDFNKAAEECTSVLELDYKHTGALMLRAQTLVTLKQYHSALFDVNRLIELNPSSEVYRNFEARLKTQVSLAPIPEDEAEFEEDDSYNEKTQLDNSNEEDDDDNDEDDKKAKDRATRENGKQSDVVTANSTKNSDFDKVELRSEESPSQNQIEQGLPTQRGSGWQMIPKPKGHSHLDYSRWDCVEDGSTEEDDDDEDEDYDCQPQYRFRVKTVDVKAVK